MSRALTPPSAGQPIRASFFAELLREIRANRPLSGQNTRVQRTSNGTHISAVASASSASTSLPGCWQYVPPTDTEAGTFKFPYFIVGARLYRAKDEEIAFTSAFEDCIVCVDVNLTGSAPVVTIETPEDFAGVQSLQAVDGHSVHPLYQFEGTAVACDFRNIPNMGAWEFQE